MSLLTVSGTFLNVWNLELQLHPDRPELPGTGCLRFVYPGSDIYIPVAQLYVGNRRDPFQGNSVGGLVE